ncbi:TPA: isoprenylcysteine carboxyl methyltransferase family protein [Streptococcus suis]|uniref:isoprenylcysteine carboxyl methyltransferase family protein n=1 Tax=Streptococcus suis TaxID=1307 RepID=UPI0009426E69|nr:isoprenylcysteine carboxyl methyltransferase family protein [Streptococcus suis]HEL2399157.1 isoprenylcysteine carboxyl methyltransferase family protein [Streptococcus suis]HEM3907544.1 isoprenylcysteine carboxyl methyltransferase family protein [Streptococcus suis]HEM4016930.1 isoprenylcysteine carboxyl methyltransferase family protein [Streptococcus suis]HEM4037669.1 isoprenylcysteine carboxyl methyltransferase family protein [Streptococcus suis]HEM4148782.1 isoprenylcysteine carboxyl met
MIVFLVICIFLVRIYFLKISIKNEKRILKNGGSEFGVQNTKLLTVVHILFYLSCLIEAVVRHTKFDTLSSLGLIFLLFSMGMLFWVTRLLGDIWTVKLMLVKGHRFVDHWLFRVVKHPNYFLNIIPELIGLALLCHATYSFLILFPVYMIILYRRIHEENNLLKTVIIPNGTVQSAAEITGNN